MQVDQDFVQGEREGGVNDGVGKIQLVSKSKLS